MADHMTAEQFRTELMALADGLAQVTVDIGDADIASEIELSLRQLAARLSGMAAAPAVPDQLLSIGHLLRTQDNRITDQPIFIVQQKREYVTADGYNDSRAVWVDREGRQADDATALRFDTKYAGTGRRPKGWRHLSVFHAWEFVTACFTEQGCKDYIARNGHNLTEPRIYADGSYRNAEYRAVREWLKALPAPAAPEPPHG